MPQTNDHPSAAAPAPLPATVRVLGGNVLIRADPKRTQVGAIHLTDETIEKERQVVGTVLAVGPGAVNELTGDRLPIDVSVGDRVLYPMYAGTEIPGYAGHRVLSSLDVLAVLGSDY